MAKKEKQPEYNKVSARQGRTLKWTPLSIALVVIGVGIILGALLLIIFT